MVKKSDGVRKLKEKKDSNKKSLKFNFKKFSKNNYGLILAGILAVILLSFLIFGDSFWKFDFIGEKQAGKLILNLFLEGGYDAQLKDVVWNDNIGLYLVSLIVEGKEEIVYVDSNKQFFVNNLYSLEKLSKGYYSEEDFNRGYSSEELNSLSDFVSCLNEKNLKIYGINYERDSANLIGLFGGWEIIKPIYIDCFWETELCFEKKIRSYPSVMLNDSLLGLEIALDDFSQKTNCSLNHF